MTHSHTTTVRDLDPVQLVVCEHCDSVYQRVPLESGERATCARCGAVVGRHRRMDVNNLLAVSVTALIVFAIANISPIVAVGFQGRTVDSTLFETFIQTWKSGYWPISLLAALMTFIAPLIQLVALIHILVPLRHGERSSYFIPVMHLLRWMRPWSMVEVFMFGALVAIVRLWGFTTVTPRIGIFAFGALTILMTWVGSVDLHRIWSLAREDEDDQP